MPTISYANANDATPYTLNLINNSSTTWTFYVYQQLPKLAPNVFSLAWICSPYALRPGGTTCTFRWAIQYDFMWGAPIMPGEIFQPLGSMPIDLQTAITKPWPGLTITVQGDPPASLVITEDAKTPSNASIGIGMSGSATFVANADPDSCHTFPLSPTYWIAAGTNVQVGTILNISTITPTAQVIFPPAKYNMTGTLGPDNQWTIQ